MTPPPPSPPRTGVVARGAAPTTNADLRARLAELTTLALRDDIDGFVAKFIPRDLEGSDDAAHFLASLKTRGERWAMVREEIALIDAGRCVVISGDHVTTCAFRFDMPGFESERGGACVIDREVEFMNYAEDGERADWRAVG